MPGPRPRHFLSVKSQSSSDLQRCFARAIQGEAIGLLRLSCSSVLAQTQYSTEIGGCVGGEPGPHVSEWKTSIRFDKARSTKVYGKLECSQCAASERNKSCHVVYSLFFAEGRMPFRALKRLE